MECNEGMMEERIQVAGLWINFTTLNVWVTWYELKSQETSTFSGGHFQSSLFSQIEELQLDKLTRAENDNIQGNL